MLEGQVESDNSISFTKLINNDNGNKNTMKFIGTIDNASRVIKGKAV